MDFKYVLPYKEGERAQVFNFNEKQLPCKAVVKWFKGPGDVLMAKIKQRNNYSNQKKQVLKTNGEKQSVYYQICKYWRNVVFLNVILPSELSKL